MLVRSAVLACGLSVAATGAIAQDQAPPPPPAGQMQGPPPGGPHDGMMDPGRRAEHLKHELSLSEDQTRQVKAIFEDSRTRMEALRSSSSLSREDRHSQMMAIRQAENDKIEALLTPDQKTKYDAMRARMRDRMRGGPGGPPPGDTAPPPPGPPQN